MDDYKEVTSAIEGRLSLRSGKASKREVSDEDYFQSRVDRPPTVNSWLSGKAISDFSLGKSNEAKDQLLGASASSKAPRPERERKSKKALSSTRTPGDANSASTTEAVSLTIELAQPNLYLEGFTYQHCTEHRSAVLRGVLHLKVRRKATLRELSLRFDGTSETVWPESWRLRHLKKHLRETIINHEWNFLETDVEATNGKKATGQSFEPGTYDYPFELPLDSSLPESIELPMGAVYYSLTATALQTGHVIQTGPQAQRVNLIRIPCTCSLEMIEPCGATGLQHGLRYSFMLHGQSFPVGGQVPLGIRLVPAPECSWQRITITIEEDTRYRTRDGLAQREQSRCKAILLDKRTKQDDLAQRAFRRISAAGERMSTTYAGSATIEKPRRGSHNSQESLDAMCLQEKVVLQLPSCSKLQADTAYSCIYVRHTLVVSGCAQILNETF